MWGQCKTDSDWSKSKEYTQIGELKGELISQLMSILASTKEKEN